MITTPVVQLGRMNHPEAIASAATTSASMMRRSTARRKCFMRVRTRPAGTERVSLLGALPLLPCDMPTPPAEEEDPATQDESRRDQATCKLHFMCPS